MPKKNLAQALAKPNGDKEAAVESEQKTAHAASRNGKKHIGAYFDLGAYHQLNLLAAEQTMERNEKVTLQNIMGEALNDLFKKYGKAPIA